MPSDAEILAALAETESFEQTLRRHPELTRDGILSCLVRAQRAAAKTPASAPRHSEQSAEASSKRERLRVYSDGAARGNPGPAGAGAVVVAGDGQVLAQLGRFLGETTNNVAEYQGLLLGLRHAAELGARAVDVYADSQLMIRQLGGQYRVRNEGLKPLFDEAMRLLRAFGQFTLHHIPREQNAAADEMSNRAIDERL